MPGMDWFALGLASLLVAGIVQIVSLLREVETRREDWRLGERRLAWRPFWLRDIGAVLLVILAASLLFAKLAGPRLTDVDPAAEPIIEPKDLLLQFFSFQLLIVVLAVVLVRWRGLRWRDAFSDPSAPALGGLIFSLRQWLALFPIMLMVGALTNYVLTSFGVKPRLQNVLEMFQNIEDVRWMFLAFFFAVVGAPVSEEILFRGMLLPALAKWTGVPVAIFISSAAFSAIHMQWQQAPALFVLSLVLSLNYLYTRRLGSAIFLHAVFNLFMLILSLRMPDAPPV